MKTRVFFHQTILPVIFISFITISCNKSDYFEKNTLSDKNIENPEIPNTEVRNNHDDYGQEGPEDIDYQDEDQKFGNSSDDENIDVNSADNGSNDGSENNDFQTEIAGNSEGGVTGEQGDCNQGHGNESDHLDGSNPNVATEPRCKEEKFFQRSKKADPVDIIWIVDNSGSMQDEQESVAKNFKYFIDSFINRNVDFQMAITTTDIRKNNKSRLTDQSINLLNSTNAKYDPEGFLNSFKNLIQVGTDGSYVEQGLLALDELIYKKGQSFLRNDAQLAIICLSDEEDQSPLSLNNYLARLKATKSDSTKIKFYSVVDSELINSGRGITTGFYRYKEMSDLTNGLLLNIREDFYRSLSLIGETIVNLLDSFQLKHSPKISTLRVYVSGEESKNFQFDAVTNSIRFLPGHIPNEAEEIIVRYEKI